MTATADDVLFLLKNAVFECLATLACGLLVTHDRNGSVNTACNNVAARESVLNTRIK